MDDGISQLTVFDLCCSSNEIYKELLFYVNHSRWLPVTGTEEEIRIKNCIKSPFVKLIHYINRTQDTEAKN